MCVWQAYQETLRGAGIEPDPRWVRPLIPYPESWINYKSFVDRGYEKMKLWLGSNWAELNCTAILAHNDETAIGVIQALNDVGISAPDQVSVIGFDGTEISDYVRPNLATVKVPLEEVGAVATAILLRQIRERADGNIEYRSDWVMLRVAFGPKQSTAVVPHA